MSEQNQQQMPKEVLDEFRAIRRAVLQLFAHVKLYTSFRNPDHLEIMRGTTPGAFGLIMVALRNEITMAHGRLFDPAETSVKKEVLPNLSFAHLLKSVEAHCPSEVSSRFQDKFKETKDQCAPMLTWRKKRVGHSDWKTALAPANDPLPTIELVAIKEGLRMIGELFNEIDRHFNSRTNRFDDVVMDGTGDDLMTYLKIALDARDQEAKEKYGIDLKARRAARKSLPSCRQA